MLERCGASNFLKPSQLAGLERVQRFSAGVGQQFEEASHQRCALLSGASGAEGSFNDRRQVTGDAQRLLGRVDGAVRRAKVRCLPQLPIKLVSEQRFVHAEFHKSAR